MGGVCHSGVTRRGSHAWVPGGSVRWSRILIGRGEWEWPWAQVPTTRLGLNGEGFYGEGQAPIPGRRAGGWMETLSSARLAPPTLPASAMCTRLPHQQVQAGLLTDGSPLLRQETLAWGGRGSPGAPTAARMSLGRLPHPIPKPTQGLHPATRRCAPHKDQGLSALHFIKISCPQQ